MNNSVAIVVVVDRLEGRVYNYYLLFCILYTIYTFFYTITTITNTIILTTTIIYYGIIYWIYFTVRRNSWNHFGWVWFTHL